MNQNFDPKKTNTVVLQRGVKVLPYHDRLLCENLHKTSSFYPKEGNVSPCNAVSCVVQRSTNISKIFINTIVEVPAVGKKVH